jgi:hypothetical protein
MATYGGMEIKGAMCVMELEGENRSLTHLIAYLTLDNQGLKAVIRERIKRPVARRLVGTS